MQRLKLRVQGGAVVVAAFASQVVELSDKSSLFTTVGYTMQDIRYTWKDGFKSVGIAREVQLPQFQVLGHRQRATEINLSTGRPINIRWLVCILSHCFPLHETNSSLPSSYEYAFETALFAKRQGSDPAAVGLFFSFFRFGPSQA